MRGRNWRFFFILQYFSYRSLIHSYFFLCGMLKIENLLQNKIESIQF